MYPGKSLGGFIRNTIPGHRISSIPTAQIKGKNLRPAINYLPKDLRRALRDGAILKGYEIEKRVLFIIGGPVLVRHGVALQKRGIWFLSSTT
jgi:hypothetical protein